MAAAVHSYGRFDLVPIGCRALFTLRELIEIRTCPDPRKALTYRKPRRLTKEEEQKQHPERWTPKMCDVCGDRFKRTFESWAEWKKRVVCGRKCGAMFRARKKNTAGGRMAVISRARLIRSRLRNGIKVTHSTIKSS